MHSSYYTAGSFDVYAVNYIFKSFKKSKLKMMDEYLLAKKKFKCYEGFSQVFNYNNIL